MPSLPLALGEVPTPALLVDVAAMQRNIDRMAAFFAGRSSRVRPHFKAHKTPEIARRQLAAGACSGLTCATVSEAETAAAVCDDILVANEIVSSEKCRRLAALARQVTVTVAVDSVTGLTRLGTAAREAGVEIGVLVDLDIGMGRCGVRPGDDAVALARLAVATGGLELRGLMGYEGHLVGLHDRRERESRTRAAMAALLQTSERLRAEGLPCPIVSSGGTGTYDIDGALAGITEVQAGSYVLMDTEYGRLDLPFEQAFSILGTVVSRPAPDRCVADCGHKATTKDHGLPSVKGIAGATVRALNDEHVTIGLPADSPVRVGDSIELVPSHIDPTINLHDVFYAVEGGQVVGIWPIAARGYRNR